MLATKRFNHELQAYCKVRERVKHDIHAAISIMPAGNNVQRTVLDYSSHVNDHSN